MLFCPISGATRVLCVTSGNTYLEASLLLTTYLDVTYVAPGQYPPPSGQSFDVTIFDDVTPPVAPGSGNVLYLNPSGDASPVKVEPAALANVGFDIIDRKSPLLKWTAIDDVYIGRAHKLVPQPGDKVIGASDKGALLVAGRRDDRRFVALGFHPRDSDLVLRIAWPLFVLNVLTDFVAEDASYLSSFRTGEIWHIQVPTLGRVWLKGPSAAEPPGSPAGRTRVHGRRGRVPFARGRSEGSGPIGFAANLATAQSRSSQADDRGRRQRSGAGVRFHVGVGASGGSCCCFGHRDHHDRGPPPEDHGMSPRGRIVCRAGGR
jgi:hypothetical protein